MDYYKKFKFTGDVYAMPEGSMFFANEPLIRIVAPIIEAQMIEILSNQYCIFTNHFWLLNFLALLMPPRAKIRCLDSIEAMEWM